MRAKYYSLSRHQWHIEGKEGVLLTLITCVEIPVLSRFSLVSNFNPNNITFGLSMM